MRPLHTEQSRADGTGVISSIGNACVRFSTAAAAAAAAAAATELYRILCMEYRNKVQSQC